MAQCETQSICEVWESGGMSSENFYKIDALKLNFVPILADKLSNAYNN